jgi:hypothetical protein
MLANLKAKFILTNNALSDAQRNVSIQASRLVQAKEEVEIAEEAWRDALTTHHNYLIVFGKEKEIAEGKIQAKNIARQSCLDKVDDIISSCEDVVDLTGEDDDFNEEFSMDLYNKIQQARTANAEVKLAEKKLKSTTKDVFKAHNVVIEKEEYLKQAKIYERDVRKDEATAKKQQAKVLDQYLCLKFRVEELELKETINNIDKQQDVESKAVVKQQKKQVNYFSEPILKYVNKLPVEIRYIISGYLPYEVRCSLLDFKFKRGLYGSPEWMRQDFLNVIACNRSFLRLLPKTEARQQIRSINPRGLHWREYSYTGGNEKLCVNRIRWAIEMTKAGNPAFAYKMMKTIAILGTQSIFKQSTTYRSAKRLTQNDLPEEYRSTV